VDNTHAEVRLFEGFDDEVEQIVSSVLSRNDINEDNYKNILDEEVDNRDTTLKNLMCEDTEKY